MGKHPRSQKSFLLTLFLSLFAVTASTGQVPTLAASQSSSDKDSVSTSRRQAPTPMERRVSLQNGRTLILSSDGNALIERDAKTGGITHRVELKSVRIGASLTMMPQGRVLVWGAQRRTAKCSRMACGTTRIRIASSLPDCRCRPAPATARPY